MGGKAQNVKDFRRRRKEYLIQVLGSCCSLCGYNKCNGALEFHHIEPDNKKYQLSSGNCHKLEDDLEEAKKCILVCANCHREIHSSDLYKDVDLWQYQVYNEDSKKQVLDKNKKEQEKYVCSNCGAQITRFSKSGLCISCVQLGKKRVENKPDRETLKQLIRTISFTKIGDMYNCSDNAVRKWCDKFNLPRKKSDIVKYSDDQWAKI